LPGLDPSVVPVELVSKSHHICYKNSKGMNMTHTIKLHQFPMTNAYMFTDYQAQGQTIPYLIVDIAKPPSSRLNLFNLYVCLRLYICIQLISIMVVLTLLSHVVEFTLYMCSTALPCWAKQGFCHHLQHFPELKLCWV
ncbi:hypothetical protein PISMIDRAFT_98899, partial [Pisolithus microcarpus 441]